MEDSFARMLVPEKIQTKKSIYDCLKNWIIYSDLKPGEPIKERCLSSVFGISRTPLREILQLLCYRKLVVIKPRKGVFVAPIDLFLIKSIFETRLTLEKFAVSLAATRRSQTDIRKLEALITELEKSLEKKDTEGFIRLDQKYHEIIGRITRNSIMAETLEALHNPCLRYWFLNRHEFDAYTENFKQLNALTQAIKNKDQNLAASISHAHVNGFLTLPDVR